MCLPWRRLAMFSKPRRFRIVVIALLGGCKIFCFWWMVTEKVKVVEVGDMVRGPLLHPGYGIVTDFQGGRGGVLRVGLVFIACGPVQYAEAAGDFLVGFGEASEVLSEAVFVQFFLVGDVPDSAGVGADFVGEEDLHAVFFVQASEFQFEVDQFHADGDEQSADEVVDSQGEGHDVVEFRGAGPAEGGDVFFADQGVAQFVGLVVEFDDGAGQFQSFFQSQAFAQGAGGDVAHDDFDGNDGEFANQLLAHVQGADEVGGDSEFVQAGEQEFGYAVVEHSLAFHGGAFAVVECGCVVLEVLDQGAWFGSFVEALGFAFVDLLAIFHLRLLREGMVVVGQDRKFSSGVQEFRDFGFFRWGGGFLLHFGGGGRILSRGGRIRKSDYDETEEQEWREEALSFHGQWQAALWACRQAA